MVRVAEVPVAVAGGGLNTPFSISTTDMGVRMASLDFLVQLFRVVTANSGSTRDAATAIDRSGRDLRPGSHYRRPRAQAGPDMTRGSGAPGNAQTAPRWSLQTGWR